jgi:hypothetical protein
MTFSECRPMRVWAKKPVTGKMTYQAQSRGVASTGLSLTGVLGKWGEAQRGAEATYCDAPANALSASCNCGLASCCDQWAMVRMELCLDSSRTTSTPNS